MVPQSLSEFLENNILYEDKNNNLSLHIFISYFIVINFSPFYHQYKQIGTNKKTTTSQSFTSLSFFIINASLIYHQYTLHTNKKKPLHIFKDSSFSSLYNLIYPSIHITYKRENLDLSITEG